MPSAIELGMIAATLQVAGYLFYGSKVLARDISPNPTSWLMFAYGTTLLAVLEWDRDASIALLALPITCAVASIIVVFHALRNARTWLPEHFLDRFSFGLDILLTVVYVSTWLLLLNGTIVETQKDLADIIILVCWNLGVFTAFYPLLRQVYRRPETEHAIPWLVWTLAYFMLMLATVSEVGGFNELALYPLANVVTHGFVALHTALWRYRKSTSLV